MKKFLKSLVCCAVLASMAVSSLVVSAANTHKTDPNGDGVIDVADLVFVSSYLVASMDVPNLSALDFNGDGFVSKIDQIAIQRYLAKMDY